ncbi:hypothetical protein PVT68_14090 [Microbulbifer bruguierae]|uniref:DNA mismatch repair proteins mutS family domain-containing protein n=1 Tax=Microbulbifer bruguierae TaxID=3029061 RepID=A0ABY8NB38_9GAMM|nr:hypothetical protein [Microbulbifer bruguierae]WGL15895.1 hypothetical protein PVT68_14090 [Microbulbifer bruguierae]
MSNSSARPDLLDIDSHTFKDLEIFTSDNGGASLFDFCNRTRSVGGAALLRRRMQTPWACAERIAATQAAVRFITESRALFKQMPSVYAVEGTQDYLEEILPSLDFRNRLEFALGAFQVWANQDSHYFSIVKGAQAACRMIRALRSFVALPALKSAPGELGPLLQQLRALLSRPNLRMVPDFDVAGWGTWKMLKLDQALRVKEKDTLNRLLALNYEMEALVSMADANAEHGFVMPEICYGPLHVTAEGLYHPYLAHPVANPVSLNQQHRILFLTGPNMAGKTTYLRAFATALYLAHLGMGVPAQSFQFVPVQCLFSSISLTDDLCRGVSYFRAEALRVKAVAEAVARGDRVLTLMDEPFKGTNVKDAFEASLAILERFSTRENCLFMFSSHQIELSDHLHRLHNQVNCRYFEAVESGERLHFDYKLRPGISDQRLGMRVLREEGIFELLDQATAPEIEFSPAEDGIP